MRNANRRDSLEHPPGMRRSRTAAGSIVPPAVQPKSLSACLWKNLPQHRSHDSRSHLRNGGWHGADENRRHDPGPADGAVSMDPGATHLHREETLEEVAAPGSARVVE